MRNRVVPRWLVAFVAAVVLYDNPRRFLAFVPKKS
jgi:hypothetical protein